MDKILSDLYEYDLYKYRILLWIYIEAFKDFRTILAHIILLPGIYRLPTYLRMHRYYTDNYRANEEEYTYMKEEAKYILLN